MAAQRYSIQREGSSGTRAMIVTRAAVAVSAVAMMTKRRSKRSESQPIGQARRNPPRVPLAIKDGNSAGIEAQPLRKDWAQSEECTCDHPAQRGRHHSEGRLLIQPFRADPGALG